MVTCTHFIFSSIPLKISEAFPCSNRSLHISNSASGIFQQNSLESFILSVPSFRADSHRSGAFICSIHLFYVTYFSTNPHHSDAFTITHPPNIVFKPLFPLILSIFLPLPYSQSKDTPTPIQLSYIPLVFPHPRSVESYRIHLRHHDVLFPLGCNGLQQLRCI